MCNNMSDEIGGKVRKIVFVMGLTFLMSACGGGGDSSSDNGGGDNPTNSEIVPTDMSGPPDSIYS